MEYFHLNKLLHICLLTDCNTKEEEIEKSLLWSIEKEQVSYCFPVSSTNDFNYASSMIEKYHLKGSILPFYTHTNQSFFKEYVYQEEEDISGLHRNKKNIFANQQINTHFLGIYKLIVTEKYILMSTWSLSEIVKKKSMNSFLKK